MDTQRYKKVTNALMIGVAMVLSFMFGYGTGSVTTGEAVAEEANEQMQQRDSEFVFAQVNTQTGVSANSLNPYRVRIYGWRDTEGRGEMLSLVQLDTWEVAHSVDPKDALEQWKHREARLMAARD